VGKKRKKPRRRGSTPPTPRPAQRRARLGVTAIPSPLAHLSDAERSAFVDGVVAEAAQRFAAGLPALDEGILSYEPLSLLAHLAFYHLVSPDGIEREPPGRRPVFQHHVELLQAFALRHDRDAFAWMPTFPDGSHFLELLDDTCWAFVFRFDGRSGSEEERARLSLQARQRMATLALRNWGYPDQVAQTVTDRFAPLDDRIEAACGVRVGALFAMCLRLVEVVEERWNVHFDRLVPVAKARTVAAALAAHERTFPEFAGSADTMRHLLDMARPGLPLADLKEQLIHHLNLRLENIYTVDLGDAVAAYPGPVDPEVLRSALDGWSWRFGDLADRDPERFFLANPVWTRPLIALEEGRYYLPIPGLFYGFGLELMEGIVRGRSPLSKTYDRRRSTYLEDEVARLFAAAFPSAELFRGSKWSDPADASTVYENDMLVRLDTVLFVVEAKAGRFSDAARRGALKSLGSDVGDLHAYASAQGERFAVHLRARPAVHRFPSDHGVNEVDTTQVP
jgi:hypothetical protein